MMTPAHLAILAAEISQDPLGIGYATCFPHAPGHAVDLINAPTQTMVKAIRSSTAMGWAATGPYAAIVDASNNLAHPCRASCLVLRDTFAAGADIHLELPSIQAMLNAWVATLIITQAQRDSLIALATQPASRVEVLGLGSVSESDIRTAIGE